MGRSFVEVEDELAGASEAERRARAEELTRLKTVAVGWFLNIRLSDKPLTSGSLGDPNRDTYPGFHAIVRVGDWTISNLTPTGDGKHYTFDVKLQVAGPPELIEALPGTKLAGDPQWRTGVFDPTTMAPAELEMMQMMVSPQPRSRDAWLDFAKLYADGKLTIDAHYGYDYLDGYDISNSYSLYKRLVGQGFSSPSDRFETYQASLGPLSKTYSIGGRPVRVEVRIFHGASQGLPGPDGNTDEGGRQMANDMRDSLAHSGVILFSGHSGPYYGFELANWNNTSAGSLGYAALAIPSPSRACSPR